MFNHFKPTPRKPQGGVSRGLTASQNHRICVQHGYILARQQQPEPQPVEGPAPFCDAVTDVAVAAAESAIMLPAGKATPVLKDPRCAKGVSKNNRAVTLHPSLQPENPAKQAGIFKAAAKRAVDAANPDSIKYRYITLPDIQDSS